MSSSPTVNSAPAYSAAQAVSGADGAGLGMAPGATSTSGSNSILSDPSTTVGGASTPTSSLPSSVQATPTPIQEPSIIQSQLAPTPAAPVSTTPTLSTSAPQVATPPLAPSTPAATTAPISTSGMSQNNGWNVNGGNWAGMPANVQSTVSALLGNNRMGGQ